MFMKKEFVYNAGMVTEYVKNVSEAFADFLGVDILRHGHDITVLRTYSRSKWIAYLRFMRLMRWMRGSERDYNEMMTLIRQFREKGY